MEKLDFREKFWGGIFGVLAIIAVVAEVFVNGVSAATIWGAVKDVSGTLIVVILFVAVVKSLLPKRNKKPFAERLELAIKKWWDANSNMIIKWNDSDGNKEQFGLSMKTDMNAFYSNAKGKRKPGVFFRVPVFNSDQWQKEGVEIEFWLNDGTFVEDRTDLSKEEKEQILKSLATKFANYIALSYADFCTVSSISNKRIYVKLNNPVQEDAEIERLIDLINSMYQAYLVSANIVV